MKKTNLIQFFMKQVKSITIEPLLFMIAFSLSLIGGAQVTTNLLIWKICHVELHYSEEVCGNLSLDINKLAEQVSISSTFYTQLLRQYFDAKKLQSQNITREKLHKTLLYEKFACKMLMKLKTVANFINILRAAFLANIPLPKKSKLKLQLVTGFETLKI
jgi:hypothetical protein